jgi:hypothetical protein
MTFQDDPNSPRRPNDYIDRAPTSFSAAAVVGGLAIIGVLAFLIFSFSGDRTGDPLTPRSPGAIAPTTNSGGTTAQPKTVPSPNAQ